MVQKTLGHYEVLEKIGAGAMGEVYAARGTRLGRRVAVKLIGPRHVSNPQARARLMREARTASSLNHPNTCTVHDIGTAEDFAYLVMELVEGRTLEDLIRAHELSSAEVVEYYDQARIHLALADRDRAMTELEQAVEEGGNWLNYIRPDPAWSELRGDTRFERIVDRVFSGT